MPPPPPRPKTKTWSRPLADLVGQAVDPVFARQGFSQTDLILHWDDIVGARLAAGSRPIKLQWPPRPPGRAPEAAPQPATLVIRVEAFLSLELQHAADQVLARVNAHLGWRCVGKLSFRQGPIERDEPPPRRRPVSAAALATAAESLTGIGDARLRDALARLGARVAEGRDDSVRDPRANPF